MTCWGLHDGMGHINTRELHDGTRDEAIARPVTGHTRQVHDGSRDRTATGHASMRGQPSPTWVKELEEGRATGDVGDHDGPMTGPRRDLG